MIEETPAAPFVCKNGAAGVYPGIALLGGHTSTDTDASVRRAEKGVDLLKGPEAGVMTAVYKELGVKPLAGAAVEGMATSLFHDMSAAFSKRKPSDNATAARRRVLQNLRRKAPAVHSAAAYVDGEEEDEAANTIDILWKLDD